MKIAIPNQEDPRTDERFCPWGYFRQEYFV